MNNIIAKYRPGARIRWRCKKTKQRCSGTILEPINLLSNPSAFLKQPQAWRVRVDIAGCSEDEPMLKPGDIYCVTSKEIEASDNTNGKSFN